eukprot:6909936-Alexandrium_andersonii.AAC.1
MRGRLAQAGRAGPRKRMPARVPRVLKRVGRCGQPVAQRSLQTRSGSGVSVRVCRSARGARAASAVACRIPRARVSSRAPTPSQ